MPKYNVCANEVTYYLTKVIEAKNKAEAEEKYSDMIAEGNVEEVNSDGYECEVTLFIDESVKKRLKYLRKQIDEECISTGEIVELQSLAEYIDKDDVILLEWAGVKENVK